MEHSKSGDTRIISQKENDPPFTRDENERITLKETTDLNLAQQVGGAGGCSKCLHIGRPQDQSINSRD